MPRYVIHTYTVTDPKTGRRWHKQNPWNIARLVMMHGDWKRYESPRAPWPQNDVSWRITCSILNGTWDNQFAIEPDGEMIGCYVPPEPSTPKNESFAEVLQAFDQRLRVGGTYSTFQDTPREIVMANMLWTMRKISKQQQLGDRDREVLDKLERTFAFQTRRETAMAMLLWELRKEYEQRFCTMLSHPATEGEMLDGERERVQQLVDRIDDTLVIKGT